MPTKDELETKLYEKMSQENEAFLAEMKTPVSYTHLTLPTNREV